MTKYLKQVHYIDDPESNYEMVVEMKESADVVHYDYYDRLESITYTKIID